MNVNDATAPEPTGDRLEMIFDRQRELSKKYSEIEGKAGIGRGILPATFHIDDPKCQYFLKDLAWRVTEELAEAIESMADPVHCKEEVADAWHFLVELVIEIGLGPADVVDDNLGKDRLDIIIPGKNTGLDSETVVMFSAWKVVETLGLAMNCLKNKPWKQSHVSTDVDKFEDLVVQSVGRLGLLSWTVGMSADAVFELYFKKSEVNRFRQRSEY